MIWTVIETAYGKVIGMWSFDDDAWMAMRTAETWVRQSAGTVTIGWRFSGEGF